MTPEEREEALVVAKTAALEAGAILTDYFGRLDRAKIGHKSAARDLVTEADVASERHLVQCLRRSFAEHRIQAEEEVSDAGEWNRGPRWFLDPLDGTVNFVHQLPAFCVSMALWWDGVPEVAVVHAPRLGETFTAVRDGGAECNGKRLAVSAAEELSECVLGTGFPYRRNELEHDNLANFSELFHRVRGLRRMGSAALDLAFTAAGRLDGFWELWLSPHDVAAGALLVREAGGVVTDLDGGEDWLTGGHIAAGPEAVHGALLALLRH